MAVRQCVIRVWVLTEQLYVGTGQQLVEDMKVALARLLRCNSTLLQQIWIAFKRGGAYFQGEIRLLLFMTITA